MEPSAELLQNFHLFLLTFKYLYTSTQRPVLLDFKALKDKSTGKHYTDACYWLTAI